MDDPHMPSDPNDPALWLKLGSEVSAGLGVGLMAGLARLATYSGPPRPWSAALLDAGASYAVGLVIWMLMVGFHIDPALSVGAAIGGGMLGWECTKRAALRWLNRQGG